MPLLRAEAGSRPAGEALFFASPKKSAQKKGDPAVCVPCADATGQPAVLGFGGVSLNSRRCASLRHTRALIRQTLRSSAHPQGHWGQNFHTGHCFARPQLAGASATRCAAWAERSNGPNGCWLFGCSDVPPLLAAPAAGRLRGGMGVGAPMLRALTRRSCLNEARQRAVSSAAHPATDTPQVCPVAKRRGRRLGVAFSLVTFFWRSKRKLLARRATPGLRPYQRHAAQSATTRKRYKINSYHRISH
ncbi:hypothetical protein ATF69_4326 [Acidovorax delafieldii]|uniref:Uncharacterized protein n=1 Tax=Acidovorax delafieldii TaxID=47920 RepID=A0A561XAW7_ACIDE|nr:hypothetical protein ATF69_4326 [Acidovorax delafieldii]